MPSSPSSDINCQLSLTFCFTLLPFKPRHPPELQNSVPFSTSFQLLNIFSQLSTSRLPPVWCSLRETQSFSTSSSRHSVHHTLLDELQVYSPVTSSLPLLQRRKPQQTVSTALLDSHQSRHHGRQPLWPLYPDQGLGQPSQR